MSYYGVITAEGSAWIAALTAIALAPPSAPAHILLESGDSILLETGDLILLE